MPEIGGRETKEPVGEGTNIPCSLLGLDKAAAAAVAVGCEAACVGREGGTNQVVLDCLGVVTLATCLGGVTGLGVLPGGVKGGTVPREGGLDKVGLSVKRKLGGGGLRGGAPATQHTNLLRQNQQNKSQNKSTKEN